MNGHVSLPRRQRGLTLVELLIALVLGLVVVAGVIQIFMSGNASYKVQEGLGRTQENARFAEFFLSRILRQAGRPWVFGAPSGSPGPFFQPIDTRVDETGLPATRDGLPNGTGPDVVTVMYRSNTNCLGNQTTYGAQVILDDAGNRYAKDQFMLDDGDPRSLICRGLGADGLPVPGHTQPIVQGVDDFQVLYGIDTDGDGTPNSYDSADNVLPAEWLQVTSLRFALLVNSAQAVRTEAAQGSAAERTYAVLDAPLRGPYSDGRLRQVFESTIELRNRSR